MYNHIEAVLPQKEVRSAATEAATMCGADKKGRLIAILVGSTCKQQVESGVSETYVSIPDSSREFSITS